MKYKSQCVKLKLTVSLITMLFIFMVSCVSTQLKRELNDKVFVSKGPALKVEFKREVLKHESKRNGQLHGFWLEGNQFVGIDFYEETARNIDYFYELKKIVNDIYKARYLGPKVVNGHNWAKFVVVRSKNILTTGFFTRKQHRFIQVYTSIGLNSRGVAAFEHYNKTMEISKKHMEFIEHRLGLLEDLVTIIY